MMVGPIRFSPMLPGSTGARAAVYSSSQITRSMRLAARPPYSFGQLMPTQPAACIVFCHARRRSNVSRSLATRSSAASSRQRSGGRLAASQPRSCLRNASCSGAYSKSIVVSSVVRRSGQTAQAREHVEHGGEVAGAEAESAGGGEPLLGQRGGRQRHPARVALVEGELQVLLHHADVEPCVARHGRSEERRVRNARER